MGERYIESKLREEQEQREANAPWIPDWVDEIFARMFGEIIGKFFFWIGLDFWRPTSKVTLFCMTLFMPILIGLYEAIRGDTSQKLNQQNQMGGQKPPAAKDTGKKKNKVQDMD